MLQLGSDGQRKLAPFSCFFSWERLLDFVLWKWHKNTKKSPARNYLTQTEQLEYSVNPRLLCWPCRHKFNMADVKTRDCLDRNIFEVYKLISHDIFILMFCNSLEQCKISVGYSCCTRANRNCLFFSIFSPEFLESINMTPSIYNKSGVMWNQST